jgi:hypothetical protein
MGRENWAFTEKYQPATEAGMECRENTYGTT